MGQPASRRAPVLTVLMVIFGVILLMPGVCAIFFMVGMGPSSADSALAQRGEIGMPVIFGLPDVISLNRAAGDVVMSIDQKRGLVDLLHLGI